MISTEEFLARCEATATAQAEETADKQQLANELAALCILTGMQLTGCEQHQRVTVASPLGLTVITGTLDEVLDALVRPRDGQPADTPDPVSEFG